MAERIAMLRGFGDHRGGPSNPLPSGLGPTLQLVKSFTYQSYFSSTQFQKAILPCPAGSGIIPGTGADVQIAGYALALHSASETPVAVTFKGNDGSGASITQILKPGCLIRPIGTPNGAPSAFTGFTWGLPAGWLGGGLANLLVLQSPDADVAIYGNPEIPFHRQRIQITRQATTMPTVAAWPCNWPLKFPFWGAQSLTDVQSAAPIFKIEPTRTVLRLRLATLAAAATMRAIWMGTDHFDANSSAQQDSALQTAVGALDTTAAQVEDVVWGTTAPAGTPAVGAPSQFQQIEFTSGPFVNAGCERSASSGVVFVAAGLGSGIDVAELYVDVVRYGRLG